MYPLVKVLIPTKRLETQATFFVSIVYPGTAGDSFSYQRGAPFSTKDEQHYFLLSLLFSTQELLVTLSPFSAALLFRLRTKIMTRITAIAP